MSRKLLIVEPDAAGRTMMDRVLSAAGFAVETVASARDARELLDSGSLELVIVDELAGKRAMLDEARWLRREYPNLPVVVTGTMLSQRAMQELVRLRVMDVLVKPFTPAELRDAALRVFGQAATTHGSALEYAAAIDAARAAIVAGLPGQAKPALARAHATSPCDAEAMALQAVVAEIEGRDSDADRGYRAALALRREEDSGPPDPFEGLARLEAYKGAKPVASLRKERTGTPAWIVTDPVHELGLASPSGESASVVLLSLGIDAEAPGAIFLRDGAGPHAFALMAGAARPESIAAALATLGASEAFAHEATRQQLDFERLAACRRDARPAEKK